MNIKKALLVLFLICFINLVYATSLTGESITGKAANQETGASVYIRPHLSLYILHPIVGTYVTNESILLNFSSNGADNYWYNIDNGPNISIFSPVRFDVPGEGNYTLFLYANRSSGISAIKNVTFNVNLTIFRVIYEKYKGAYKGDSTNFYDYTYQQMLNLANIILENTLYGKMQFLASIGLPYDNNIADRTLNLDNNTNISLNRIELNSTGIPNFNVASRLWFYNLTFTNPRLLKDGSPCATCIISSYSGGTLVALVDGFSVYSAEEMPTAVNVTVTNVTTVVVNGGGMVPCNITPSGRCFCLTEWTCSDWGECVNGLQSRTCTKGVDYCEAGPKPAEENKCAPPPQIEKPIPPAKNCCLFGICGFILVMCWYWWVLIVIVIIILLLLKRRKSREIKRLKSTRGLQVYAENGEYIGRIIEVYLEDKMSKIYGWLIALDKNLARKIKHKNIFVKQEYVKSIKEIMIINEKVSENLKLFKK